MDDSQQLIFPLGMVLRSLPPEVLITDLGQLLARPAVAGGTVSVPMDQVLRQLPTGVVQFSFNVLQSQIPPELLQPPDQLATHWERPVRLPLGEVVSRIPAEVMGRRSAPTREQMEYESIDAPFRSRPQGARGRRSSQITPSLEALAASSPEPADQPGPLGSSALDFRQVPSESMALGESMPFDAEGFQPFRKAAAGGIPREGAAQAPMIKPPEPEPEPQPKITPTQSAPTMGMTGPISLAEVDQEYDIQREPTQQLAKPPPGLIAVRPPATSALPFAMDDDTFAPADIGVAAPASKAVPEPAPEPQGAFGGLSALASLAAMADSEPIDPEDQTPEPEAPAPGPVGTEAAVQQEPEAEAAAGAWWEAAASKEGVPETSLPSEEARPWQSVQAEMPREEIEEPEPVAPSPMPPVEMAPEFRMPPPAEAPPPAAVAPPVSPPPERSQSKKNWWEMPLEEAELPGPPVTAPVAATPPTTFAPKPAPKPQPTPEPAPPKGFPQIFTPRSAAEPQPMPIEEQTTAEPPAIFPVKAALRPEMAPGFIPPLSPVVPDLRRRPASQAKPPATAAPPMVRRQEIPEPEQEAEPESPIAPEVPAPIKAPVQRIPIRAPLARKPEQPSYAAPAPAQPPSVAPEPPRPRKPVTLAAPGRIGSQGRPKTVVQPQPARETEFVGAPRQRSSMPTPKLRADRMSGLLRDTCTWTPKPAAASAPRPINPRRILSRWLGLEAEREVPIQRVPGLLVNSPHIKGAAIVDEEGLTLASQLPNGVSEQAVGALSSRLFNQLRTAANEVGSQFMNQAIMTLGRWTVQITFEKPFYLVTLHDSPHFPPAVARRMRKIAGALVRQEFGG